MLKDAPPARSQFTLCAYIGLWYSSGASETRHIATVVMRPPGSSWQCLPLNLFLSLQDGKASKATVLCWKSGQINFCQAAECWCSVYWQRDVEDGTEDHSGKQKLMSMFTPWNIHLLWESSGESVCLTILVSYVFHHPWGTVSAWRWRYWCVCSKLLLLLLLLLLFKPVGGIVEHWSDDDWTVCNLEAWQTCCVCFLHDYTHA